MAPGTEFARDFCAGIGPLQLGVVLVYLFIYLFIRSSSHWALALRPVYDLITPLPPCRQTHLSEMAAKDVILRDLEEKIEDLNTESLHKKAIWQDKVYQQTAQCAWIFHLNVSCLRGILQVLFICILNKVFVNGIDQCRSQLSSGYVFRCIIYPVTHLLFSTGGIRNCTAEEYSCLAPFHE